MYKDVHQSRHSPNPLNSPIRSSSSSIITPGGPFQPSTSTLRKRVLMSNPGDRPDDVRIPFTDSEGSSGTAPALVVTTHDDPSLAGDLSSTTAYTRHNAQLVNSKPGLNVATHPPAHDPAPPSVDPNLRQTKWGIFQVAYVVSSKPLLSLAMFAEYWTAAKVLPRFLKELWTVDWQSCLEYYVWTLWLIIAPSFSLCFAYLVLFNLERIVNRQEPGLAPELHEVQFLAVMWLFSGMLSDRVDQTMIRIRAEFGGHLRPHFIPRLVKARLEWNPTDDFPHGFPAPHDYGDFIPGWDFFDDFFIRVRLTLTIGLEAVVMGYIISREEGRAVNSLGSIILGILVAAPVILTLLSPKNNMGGDGYTFWTTNREYNRLKVLFNMVFCPEYRHLLIKDGLTDSILEEYNRVTATLGVVQADTWILGWNVLLPWYWGLPLTMTVRYPMALCALILPFILSTSMITTMALLQYATLSMHRSAKSLKEVTAHLPILQILKNIRRFYDVLDSPAAPRGTLNYPKVKSLKGPKFTLKDVSYKYPSMMSSTINNVSLDIDPGQVVLIVGENGSGKSTLLKILSGLVNPTEGDVLVDHTELSRYDIDTFRKATTFVTQNEEIYPVSLRHNMLMCLSDDKHHDAITQQDLAEAARLGGSLDFIEGKLSRGFNTVLKPCSIPSWSTPTFPGRTAIDALERGYPHPKQIEISPGEQQRLVASKAFMKIKHTDTRLILLDEATNFLDSQAERKIFDQFIQISRESGQTLIIVAHRLAHLAHQADQILFMKDGKVEERGTHEQLMALSQSGYANLYNAELAIAELASAELATLMV